MLVITAGRSGPNRSLRFGGDPSLDERGRRDVGKLRAAVDCSAAIAGPESVARETCEVLDIAYDLDERLRGLDVGGWSGCSPEQLHPDDLRLWLHDPQACPHGGETVADFVARIHRWRADAAAAPDVCVVTMPVAQALLAPDAAQFFATQVRPATLYPLPS